MGGPLGLAMLHVLDGLLDSLEMGILGLPKGGWVAVCTWIVDTFYTLYSRFDECFGGNRYTQSIQWLYARGVCSVLRVPTEYCVCTLRKLF